jgi:phosphoglycerate dehydrogenase-like enzyme
VARKSVGNRQKKVVTPPRPPARRPPHRPTIAGVSAAKPFRACTLLLHDSYAAAAGAAIRSVSPAIRILTVEDGRLPPGAEATEIYLRAWEGGAAVILDRLLEEAGNLAWVHTPSVGVDHLPLPRLRQRRIILTNGRGIHTIPMAEAVLAYLLARAKRVEEHGLAQRDHAFEPLALDELFGRNVLLFGYGAIGREIAARARAFGMRICAVRRSGGREKGIERLWRPGSLADAVADADVVVVVAPLTEETRGIFDAPVFSAMREGCHFVNVSRGALAVEEALVEGLRQGRPAWASLDVFETEPLPRESPLWALPNVTITPHDAWRSPHTKTRTVELFLDNLRRFLAGRPLVNVVDYGKGY